MLKLIKPEKKIYAKSKISGQMSRFAVYSIFTEVYWIGNSLGTANAMRIKSIMQNSSIAGLLELSVMIGQTIHQFHVVKFINIATRLYLIPTT